MYDHMKRKSEIEGYLFNFISFIERRLKKTLEFYIKQVVATRRNKTVWWREATEHEWNLSEEPIYTHTNQLTNKNAPT